MVQNAGIAAFRHQPSTTTTTKEARKNTVENTMLDKRQPTLTPNKELTQEIVKSQVSKPIECKQQTDESRLPIKTLKIQLLVNTQVKRLGKPEH